MERKDHVKTRRRRQEKATYLHLDLEFLASRFINVSAA